jgi:hypothetical protein
MRITVESKKMTEKTCSNCLYAVDISPGKPLAEGSAADTGAVLVCRGATPWADKFVPLEFGCRMFRSQEEEVISDA